MAKKARTPKPPRPGGAPRPVQAPQRRAGPSRTAKAPPGRREPIRYFWPIAAVVLGLAIVGVVLGVVLTRGPAAYAMRNPVAWKNLPGLQTGRPPWPANNGVDLGTRIGNLGVDALPQEALAFHIHQHLDLYVDGKHVTVPRYIGIHIDQANPQTQFITELHTHLPDGVIHVESAKELKYQLKQFFGEWGVRLTSKCLGSFQGSCDKLRWWLNGKPQVGDPGKLVLKPHQEIVIAVGKPPSHIPSSYKFPAGE